MDPNFTRELIEDFIVEAREHFEVMESCLMGLEKNPTDPLLIQNIFRAFHTIKGNASLLKINPINDLSHRAENMLSKLRDGERTADPGTIDVILEAADTLKSMIEHLEKGEELNFDLRRIYKRIEDEINKPRQKPPPPPEPNVEPSPAPAIRQPLPLGHPQPQAPPSPEPATLPDPPKKTKRSLGNIHITTFLLDDIHVVTVAGKMDVKGSDILLRELVKICDEGAKKIILDMEMVPHLSCMGLGAIVATHDLLQERQGSLMLSRVQPDAGKIIDVTGVRQKLKLFDTLEDAMSGC